MAKKCSTCNRSYPDHLPACPHCKPSSGAYPSEDDLFVEDVDVVDVPEEGATPKPAKPRTAAKAAHETLSGQQPTEPRGEEVVDAADALEPEVVQGRDASKGKAEDSGKVDLGAAVEVRDSTSDVVALDQVEVVDSSSARRGLDPVAVVESPSGASGIEVVEVVESPSGSFAVEPVEVVESPSGASSVEVVEVIESPSGTGSPAPTDVVEEADDIVSLGAPMPPPRKAPAVPTRMASKGPAPTMIAGKQIPDELPGSELGAAPTGPAAAPDSPPPAKGAPATRIASKAPVPTMLAEGEAAADLPGGELGGPGMPNLELESKRRRKPEEPIDVLEEDVLEATEASDVRKEPIIEVVDEVEEVVEEVPAKQQGPDFEATADFPPSDSALDVLAEEVLVEGASEVDLGRKPASKSGGPSGVDMIAEALESGVELKEDSPAVKAKRKTDTVDLESPPEGGPESSAVDLGAADAKPKRRKDTGTVHEADDALIGPSSDLDAPIVKKRKAAEDDVEEVGAESLVGDEAVEAVEAVEEGAAKPRGKPKAAVDGEEVVDESLLVSDSVEAVDEELVVPGAKGKTKAETPAARTALADGEEEPDRKRRRKRAAGGGGRVLVGTLLGLLLAVGGAVAIWYFAPGVLASIPESPNLKDHKWQATGPKQPVLPQGKPASRAQEAREEHLDKGDFDGALERLKDADQGVDLVVRGEARWRKYLEEKRKAKASLNANDAPVKEALKDFTDAGNEYYPAEIDRTIKADQAARVALAGDSSIRDVLVKNKVIPAADAKDVDKALAKTLAAGQKALDDMSAVTKALQDNKLLDGKQPLKTVIEDLAAAQGNLARASDALKVKPHELAKAVVALETARKALDGKLAEVNAGLKAAGIKDADDKGVKELADARNALAKQKQALDVAVEKALEELKQGNALPQGKDPLVQLVEGTRTVRLRAESPLASSLGQMFSSLSNLGGGAGKLLQRGLESTSQATQIAAAKAREALSETPEQRLDTTISLATDRGRKDPRDLTTASKYLEWVNSKAANAGPEAKAKALYALGLVQRNQGQYAAAVKSLRQAADAVKALKDAPDWAGSGEQALKELTDASAYFLPRAQQLREDGHLKAALKELDTGLQAMPGDARLHALRGLVRLETAGKLDAPAKAAIQQDATAAQKDPKFASEAFYLLGRLQERAGDLKSAEAHFLKAQQANQGGKDAAERYSKALAEILLRRLQTGTEPEPEPAPKAKVPQTGRLAPVQQDGLAALAVLLLTGVQPPPDLEELDAETAARLKQIVKLAEDLLKSDNPRTKGEGYMILGQAYARQGKRTEGLFAYVKGLGLFYPGRQADELMKMVNEHPAFQQPDSPSRYNPLLAERHFGKGLEMFWARKYPAAEEQFKKAVAHYDQDARYQYYLGLARYAQKTKTKREAAVLDFALGARLEAANRPNTVQVNSSMERLQGEMRRLLSEYRQRIVAE